MNAYFASGRLSTEEKNDILKQHRTLYDGYRVLQNKVQNEQPLYVQDFAKDKTGAVLNNKGVAKPYTNVGINEQVKEVCDECGVRDMFEGEEMCSECGGMMTEGECTECGWKGEVGEIDHEIEEQPLPVDHTRIEENKGSLDDIYKVRDLDMNDGEFDYVEGGGNKYGTFKKSRKVHEDDDNEDDGFEDMQLDEVGYTGGGNAPDMDISNIKDSYKFKSKGPKMGNEPYDIESDDMDLDDIKDPYNFQSGGPDEVFPEGEMDEDYEFETMESAWADDEEEMKEQGWATVARIAAPIAVNYAINKLSDGEMEEANDVSGVQGMYGAMKPAYDFDSKGPGSAGPYQRSSWGGMSQDDTAEDDMYWEKDLEDNELDLDLTKFNPEDKSWEEIKAHTGDWEEIDEELQESFIHQKNKIMEMMNRMKVIK